MANTIIQLGVGILMIIIGGVLLQVGININNSLNTQFSCSNISGGANGPGQQACNTTQSNIWLILQIASYGLLFTGLFLVFSPVMGRLV